MVDPASTCSAIAGRLMVTATGLPSAGMFVNRIGTTAPPASVRVPPSDTLDNDPYSTTPSSGTAAPPAFSTVPGIGSWDTVTAMRGVPLITVSASNGAEENLAVWPGRPPANVDSAVDARPERPGRLEIDAGDAPGGFTTNCGSPVSGMLTRLALEPAARPGYAGTSRVRLLADPVSLIGPSTVYRNALDGTGPVPVR